MSGRGRARGGGRGGGGGRGDGGRGVGRGDGGRGGGRGGGYAGVAGGGYPQSAPPPAYGRGGYPQSAPPPAYGRGGNVPAPVVQPVGPAAVQPVAALSSDVEKMTIGSSSGSSVQETVVTQQPLAQPPPPSSSKALRLPVRPGYGRAGRKCIVRANHFLVKVADNDLHHYDITIKPEVTNKKVCRDIMKSLDKSFRQSHFGNRQLAYDGSKSAYTAGPLPFPSKDFVVKLEDNDRGARREREFKVSIKFASRPDLHHLRQFLASRQLDVPQETIQLFDVVLRATPSNNNAVVGRSFFNTLFGDGKLGDGLEFWKGFYQSLRPTQMGLSLNVDMSARAFYEPLWVSDFVGEYCKLRDLNRALSDVDRVKVKKALRGIRVEFSNGDYMRRYKVLSISTQPLGQLTFTDDTGGRMHVVDYFHKKYNINLRYTSLPALNAGTDAKPIYMPMEVCKIVKGQRCAKKLNERQVSNLLRATCQRPVDREASIMQMTRQNGYNEDELVGEFGIQVGREMISIDARVLNPPKVKYHETSKESVVEPFVGQWNMIDKKMVEGGTVQFWTCINFSSKSNPDAVHNFCNELVRMCRSRGMDFNPQPLLPVQTANSRYIARTLNDVHKQCQSRLKSGEHLQMLIIVLPDVSGSYGEIKRICETNLGIVSQCCQPKHVYKCNKQYLENLSLKLNVKVGGRNNVLAAPPPVVQDRPMIIFGADVTHPPPGEDNSSSIAAVVASMDWPEVTMYRALYSAQGHREEIIKDLYSARVTEKTVVHSGMIRDHLRAFRRRTGLRPERIIFYRDGVSEGQFNQVLLEEMDAIRKACQSLEPNYLPPVTFVVVQKRHHTRLFPNVHGDKRTTDRSGNILPGTVVDTNICHPTEFDFYLCSHAGIQGTSRPTHYHVLFDENKFSADGLQALTNNLTYTYARCTRSVSIVPPAYYAHLTAFRARYYMEGNTSDGNSSSEARATREGSSAVRSVPATTENVKAVMFYC